MGEYTEMPTLVPVERRIFIRNFGAREEYSVVFDIDHFICIFHPVPATDKTDLIIGAAVIRHYGFGGTGFIHPGNVKHIEVTDVFIVLVLQETIQRRAFASKDILVKLSYGYIVLHFLQNSNLCKAKHSVE